MSYFDNNPAEKAAPNRPVVGIGNGGVEESGGWKQLL
jgi:hypothetical protein